MVRYVSRSSYCRKNSLFSLHEVFFRSSFPTHVTGGLLHASASFERRHVRLSGCQIVLALMISFMKITIVLLLKEFRRHSRIRMKQNKASNRFALFLSSPICPPPPSPPPPPFVFQDVCLARKRLPLTAESIHSLLGVNPNPLTAANS